MSDTLTRYVETPEKPRVWETFGASLRLWREYPAALALPIAIVQVPIIAQALLLEALTPEDDVPPLAPALFLGLAIALVAVIGNSAVVVTVAALRHGRQLSITDAIEAVFKRLPALWVLAVILWLIYLPSWFGDRFAEDGAAAVGALLLIWGVLAFYLSIRFAASAPLLLLEGNNPVEALRGSWSLLRGYLLRLTGILLTLALLATIAAFGFDLLGEVTEPLLMLVISTLVVSFPASVVGTIATTLYYLRIRELPPPPEPQVWTPTPPPAGGVR